MREEHHPPHIFLDNAWYMVNASTHLRASLLMSPEHKGLVRDHLKTLVTEFKMHLTAWVILDNHYHILVKSNDGSKLPHFFKRLHGSTAFEINRLDALRGRQVWHNYWDTCIRTEKDYWTRFNYIHHNPVKHGYVTRMRDWPFSSYRWYLEHKGEEWLADAFARYPIKDFSDVRDDF
jgi:putative transposase